MAQVAIIGLSSFGYYLAQHLSELGSEVLAIDNNRERIEKVKNFVAKAVIADATDRKALARLELEEMDVVVISLGESLESSILAAFYLKELGVKKIVAKALSEDHARILEMVGVNQIVFPERDSGIRLAISLHQPEIVEYIPLGKGISLMEISPFKEMVGKTIRELDFRNHYHCQIVAIRLKKNGERVILPEPDLVIDQSNVLVVMGKNEDLEALQRRAK